MINLILISLGLAETHDDVEANLDAQGPDITEAHDQPCGVEGGQEAADGSKEPTASYEEESGDAVDDPMAVSMITPVFMSISSVNDDRPPILTIPSAFDDVGWE